MNRRGFLGFLGAGVAAGPKLASGIAQGVTHMANQGSMATVGRFDLSGRHGAVLDVSNSDDWKPRRIAELRSLLAGGDPEQKWRDHIDRLQAAEMGERLRLDSLRSVSPVQKHRMLIDGEAERRDRINRMRAKWELFDLLKGDEV